MVNKTAFAALNARLSAESADEKYGQLVSGNTKNFTNFPKAFNFFLKRYETDGVITKTEFKQTRFANRYVWCHHKILKNWWRNLCAVAMCIRIIFSTIYLTNDWVLLSVAVYRSTEEEQSMQTYSALPFLPHFFSGCNGTVASGKTNPAATKFHTQSWKPPSSHNSSVDAVKCR